MPTMKERQIIFDIETQRLDSYRMIHMYRPEVHSEILEEASRIMSEQLNRFKVAQRLEREIKHEDYVYLQQIHSL